MFNSMRRDLVYLFTATFFVGAGVAADPDANVAGSDQAAEVILNFEGRGALSDGSDPTPPEEALKAFRVREGFEIELIASEPEIGQPLHISWDSQGRMWVTQYLQYQFPAGLKIVEYDNHLRAQFDKVPLPPPLGEKGADKITVFEDTDGDGIYDQHRDVITGLNIATSCVTGAGGIWVSNAPYLLFFPDADGDAVPDGDPEVKLSGFGIEDTHSVMNSLKWGPDGWLYGVNGSTTTGSVVDPYSGKAVEWQGQMVWRFHPEWEKFEIFAEGGGNTFSLEIDSVGRVFSGTNNGKTRGMYYPQGSYGKKSWGKHGPLTNPYAFGYFQHMEHEGDDRRFAQAFCIYEGGLFPQEWNGKIIAPNSLHNIVWVSELIPDGTTYRTVDEEPLVETDDRWFRPVFSGVGPDGCVYMADWYDTRLSHVRPVDDWHKGSGRIYRIKPKGTKPKVMHGDLSEAAPAELVEILREDPNWVVRKRALLELEWDESDPLSKVRLLAPDEEEGKLKELSAMLDSASLAAGELLFPMYLENRPSGAEQRAAKRWQVAILEFASIASENLSPEQQARRSDIAKEFAEMNFMESGADSDASLRARLATTARRMTPELGLAIVERLLPFEEDFEDPHIPLLIWWAIEAHAEDGRADVVRLATEPDTWKSKLFREFIAERLGRRYAMAGGEENFMTASRLVEAAPDKDAKERLMTGVFLAFEGTSMPKLPEALAKQVREHAAKSGSSEMALAIQQGDKEALKKAIAVVNSSSSNPIERLELAKLFGEIEDPIVVAPLLRLLGLDQQSALKRVALQSLARYDDPSIPKTILGRYGSTLPAEHNVRSTAERVLASRPKWAMMMMDKVDEAVVKDRDVSPDVVQLMMQHNDPALNERISDHWPGIAAGSGGVDLAAEDKRIKEVLSAGAGDAAAGKVIFSTRCATCHQLFGEGMSIGPDLTPYERGNLDFWIPSIVNPSLELREGYLNYVASMKDGRVLTGLMQEQSPKTVSLRDLAGQVTVLDRTEVEKLEASPISLMPPALLSGLSDEELRDLFAYLMKGVGE